MKKKKISIILISIFTPILILTATFFGYTSIYYHAEEYNHLENITCTTYKDYSLFSKKENETDSLFIFYPGAKVESKAYIGLAETIAEEDIDVALCSMPFNLAFFGINKATKIIKELDYSHIYIGGHSLGGAMASSFAYKNGNKLDGVILLGSYATKMMPNNLKCLSLMGSKDQIVKKDKFEKNKEYFNENLYIEMIIEGGNHSNFGNYGLQNKDGIPEISNQKQWEITAKKIKELIAL